MHRKIASAERPFPAPLVTALLWATSLNPLNSSIIATSLVAIATSFHVGAGQTATLVAAVYISSAVAQPAMGTLAAQFGARRMLVVGLGIVTLAGVVGAVAASFGWLVASRALVGIGTSAGYPSAMAIIRTQADARGTGIPGRVLGGISIASQVTAALGLPLGGALTVLWGWPAVFAANIPLGLIGAALALRWLPADPPRPKTTGRDVVSALDPAGIALFTTTIVALIAVLSDVRHPSWLLAGVFLLSAAALVLWELRARSPFLDVRALVRNGALVRTYLRQALALMGAYAMLYGYVQWLQQSRGVDASVSGLIMLPMSAVAATVAALIARRALIRGPLIAGAVAMLAGGAGAAFVSSSTGMVALVALSVVFGIVLGMTTTSNQAALYTQTTAAEIAVASGLLRTAGYLGAIFASALIALAFPATATDAGIHAIGWTIVAAGVVVLVLIVADRRLPRRG
ncbi:MFS transporter [Microbacterium sp. AG790]|uniref:MFS transporter n=1 Tax=Microbacterium sp. AG790 TaxID=2183995 RepID=UPI000F25DAD4|nr:MFS transporter [Microbacterium sp. AG790]RKS94397.1 MFS transporter [Microbacterium sp. AG790]